LVVKNGSKMRWRTFVGMPMPVSVMLIWIESSMCRVAIVIRPRSPLFPPRS